MAAADMVVESTGWARQEAGSLNAPIHEEIGRLLERAAVGDRQALGEFYDATAGVVYGLALRITGQRRAAAAVTESVYVDLWEQSAAVAEGRDPLVWLAERTRAEAINYRRRPWVRLLAWLSPKPGVQTFRQREAGTLELASWEPKRQQAAAALEGLAAEERAALELAYFGGAKPAEIAKRLGRSEAEVREQLRRGVRKLREGLDLLRPPGRTPAR